MFYDWACSYRCMVKIVSTCNQTRVWEAESIFDHPVLRTNICDRLNAPEQRLSIHNFNISPNQCHLQDIWDTINLLTRTRGREEIKAACVSCISFNQTSHFYTPPPCHPFQVDTFPPPLHPQSLPLPPLYPPLLPAHCCHPLPPHCHPNKQEKNKQTVTVLFKVRVFTAKQDGYSGLLLSPLHHYPPPLLPPQIPRCHRKIWTWNLLLPWRTKRSKRDLHLLRPCQPFPLHWSSPSLHSQLL